MRCRFRLPKILRMDAEPLTMLAPTQPTQPPRLLGRVREQIRMRHYSIRTEQVYVDWVRRFILFHGKRHPSDMGAGEVAAFLSHLAVERGVSASTQNQAKAALLFLYKEVLGHIRTVQALLGHADVSTTMVCTRVLNKGGRGS